MEKKRLDELTEDWRKVEIACEAIYLNKALKKFYFKGRVYTLGETVHFDYRIVVALLEETLEALTPYGVYVTCTGECRGGRCNGCRYRGCFTIEADDLWYEKTPY